MEVEYCQGDWLFRHCLLITIYDAPIILHSHCSHLIVIPQEENCVQGLEADLETKAVYQQL